VPSDRPRRKPGPKGRIRNPAPVRDSDGEPLGEWLDGDDLDTTEVALRTRFVAERLKLSARVGEPPDFAVNRIVALVKNVLAEGEAPWWSGRGHVTIDDPMPRPSRGGTGWTSHGVGPKPLRRPVDGCLWVDTSRTPAMVRRWDGRTKAWRAQRTLPHGMSPDDFIDFATRPMAGLHTRWMMKPRFYDWVGRMVTSQMERAGRSGRPAYLAYATLADLLDSTPEKIADFLNHFRRSRRRPS
jgi:hypothetical protein